MDGRAGNSSEGSVWPLLLRAPSRAGGIPRPALAGERSAPLRSSWGGERRSEGLLRRGKWRPPQRRAEATGTRAEHMRYQRGMLRFLGTPESRVLPHTRKRPAHSSLSCSLGTYSFLQALLLAEAACIPSPRLARFILLYFCNSISELKAPRFLQLLSSWVITS